MSNCKSSSRKTLGISLCAWGPDDRKIVRHRRAILPCAFSFRVFISRKVLLSFVASLCCNKQLCFSHCLYRNIQRIKPTEMTQRLRPAFHKAGHPSLAVAQSLPEPTLALSPASRAALALVLFLFPRPCLLPPACLSS